MKILFSIVCCILVFGNSFALQASEKEKKNVLYLNSYHHGYRWSDNLLRGIRSIFYSSDYKVDLQIEYMEAKKYNYEYINTRLLTLYREKFRDENFDVIVVSDNDALNFVHDVLKVEEQHFCF